MTMKKNELRALYKEKRQRLSMAERDKLEDLILIQFQSLAVEIPALIMTYSSSDERNEYDPSLVERFCYFRNPAVVFAYPVMNGDDLIAVKVDEHTVFTSNSYGIEE